MSEKKLKLRFEADLPAIWGKYVSSLFVKIVYNIQYTFPAYLKSYTVYIFDFLPAYDTRSDPAYSSLYAFQLIGTM